MIGGRTLERQQEIDLIRRIVDRDEAALHEAIRYLGSQVRGVCRSICLDTLEADGVVSDVFWELWNRPERYDKHRGSLKSYLLLLARSRSIDHRRAVSARTRTAKGYFETNSQETRAESPCPSSSLEQHVDRAEQVDMALQKLPTAQRAALHLAFFEGLTHREVAERQELPLGTVKTNIRRGLLQLRNMLSSAST